MIDRIRERAVFRGFGRTAVRSKAGPITLVRNQVAKVDRAAVAYAIPRIVGPAVVRNRLRRQLRVVMSDLEELGELAPAAYLVVVRPGARGADMQTLRGWLHAACEGLPPSPIGGSDDSTTSDR
ncbi:MAG: ribonuclease P protein component [Microthrixaceae bacterium]